MSRTDSRCLPAMYVRPFPSVRSHASRQGWLQAPRLPLRPDIDRERKQRPLKPTQIAPWTKHSTSAVVAEQIARISSSDRFRSRITRANPASPRKRAPSGVELQTCVEACSSTGSDIRRRAMSCTISASTPAAISSRACPFGLLQFVVPYQRIERGMDPYAVAVGVFSDAGDLLRRVARGLPGPELRLRRYRRASAP